ncbi:MAG TPA: glycosyltransferase family 39 protein [Allosphingosinicella sp.]
MFTAEILRGSVPKAREAVAGQFCIFIFLLAAAFFLFFDPRTTPIVLWDESRNILNALEMRKSGLALVTTYESQPDLWNTKPPLLIWLMYGSMAIFGPSEWALRFPSAVAALATALIVILFVRRVTGSYVTGLVAGIILVLSPGFYSDHGARTADYDSLLLFFTTASLQILFFSLHRRRPTVRMSVLFGGLLACALLTKSTAALIPFAGVPIYLLATKRLWRPFESWRQYAAMGAVALAPLLVFFAAREATAPGYLDAVFFNDLLGRFQQTLIGRETSPLLFLEALFLGWFLVGPLLVLAPLLLSFLRGRERAVFLYSLMLAGAQIAICSFSATRLVHYMLPAFPWLAVAAAVAGAALWKRYLGPTSTNSSFGRATVVMVGIGLCILVGKSLLWRYREIPRPPEALYGELFVEVAERGYSKLLVSDPGIDLEGGKDPHYVPRLDAYRMIWSERGLAVQHRPYLLPPSGDTLLGSCNPDIASQMLKASANLSNVEGCAVIERGSAEQILSVGTESATLNPGASRSVGTGT